MDCVFKLESQTERRGWVWGREKMPAVAGSKLGAENSVKHMSGRDTQSHEPPPTPSCGLC